MPPQTSWIAPSGTIPASTISSTIRAATMAVAVAGLVTSGTPPRIEQAAFSAKPQAGKLKALTWTATPWRGASPWRPQKPSVLASWTPSSSTSIVRSPRPRPSEP